VRALVTLALIAVGRLASAEPREVGVDATLGIPLSPWKHDTGIGGGGSIWLHVHITPLVDVTARTGAIVHASRPLAGVPNASERLSEIPLVGGARYRLTDGLVRGYLEGEVGLIFRRVDVDAAGITDDSARIRLASALGAAIEVDRFDVRAAIWLADLADLDHEIGVVVSAGVMFYSF
jgi:hypothetical protein